MNVPAHTEISGRRILVAAWILAAIAMFLPVYRGEFLTPGSEVTVLGWMLTLLVPLILIGNAMAGYGGVYNILFALFFLFSDILFLLTLLALLYNLNHRKRLLAVWAFLLILSSCTLFYFLINSKSLFGIYLLPIPFLLASVGLVLLSYPRKELAEFKTI